MTIEKRLTSERPIKRKGAAQSSAERKRRKLKRIQNQNNNDVKTPS
jgi:hypothetical protein